MQIELNPHVTSALNKLIELTADLCRGDIIKYEDIEEACGCARRTEIWAAVVSRLRKHFLYEERGGIWLRCETNVGYYLCDATQEQLRDVPDQQAKKAIRALKRAKKALAAIPNSELTTQAQRRERQHKQDYIDEATRGVRAARKGMAASQSSNAAQFHKRFEAIQKAKELAASKHSTQLATAQP